VWNNPWHFHPEIELLYCIKARGTNFIGNYINPIEEGEILLFGKNLPHTRQRDKEFYRQHPDESIQTIVVQFRECFLGEHFFQVNEFAHVKQLLDKAQQGIKLSGSLRDEICERLVHLTKMGSNLFTATKYTGLDPQVQAYDVKSRGIDSPTNYPQNRFYSVGINTTF
jgi:hypothetical protein